MTGRNRRIYFENGGTNEGLGQRALRGGTIAMAAMAINILTQIISTIVLARLLMPEDLGLVAMAIAITGFATVFVDLGTRDAISQRESITEGEVSALVWMTFAIGLICTLLVFSAAPLIAKFYGRPQLEHITMVLSLTFLLPALYCQQYALMRRAMMFKQLAIIDIASTLLSVLVAITLAYMDHAHWALVARPVLTAFFITTGVWLSCGWWPGRPTFDAKVKDLVRFGLNITTFTMTDYIARSADRVALGYTVGPRELGFYQNASVVYENPIAVFASLHNVAVVSLSKLREDHAALRRAWSTALSSLTYFAAPAFAILAVVSQDLVVILLGSKWSETGAILSILALRGPAHVVERTLGWLHVAAGRADRWKRWGFVNCAVMLTAMACGLPFGAIGVAAAYAAVTYVLAVPAIVYGGQPLGIKVADVLRTAGPQVATALAVGGFGLFLKATIFVHMEPLSRLLALAGICGSIYLAIMVLGFRNTRPLKLLASVLRRRTLSNG